MGALVDDNSPGITELSGAFKMWLQKCLVRVKEVVQEDANSLNSNCRVLHCAIVVGCAIENEQKNVGCI